MITSESCFLCVAWFVKWLKFINFHFQNLTFLQVSEEVSMKIIQQINLKISTTICMFIPISRINFMCRSVGLENSFNNKFFLN